MKLSYLKAILGQCMDIYCDCYCGKRLSKEEVRSRQIRAYGVNPEENLDLEIDATFALDDLIKEAESQNPERRYISFPVEIDGVRGLNEKS